MLDAFRDEELVKRAGGPFKLSSLVQKRLVALNRGARPLVELATGNAMEVVVAEIMQNKIYLDDSGRLAVSSDGSPVEGVVPDDAGPSLDEVTPA